MNAPAPARAPGRPAMTSALLHVAGWAAVLVALGSPCLAAAPDGLPAWGLGYWLGRGFLHAATLAAGGLALAAVPRFWARIAGALLLAFLALASFVDSRAFALTGVHVGRENLGHLFEPQAATTLGLQPADVGVSLGIALAACGAAFALRRVERARALLVVFACCLPLELAAVGSDELLRFEGVSPVARVASALPLAPDPRFDGLLASLLGHPPAATDDDVQFPRFSRPAVAALRPSELPKAASTPFDVLYVVVESLRADALAEMPRVRAFAAGAVEAPLHRSAGNCSFLGNFSLLSGLTAAHWGMDETWRAPAGLGAFLALGYDVTLLRSAALNFQIPARVLPPGQGRLVEPPKVDPLTRDEFDTRFAEDWAKAPRERPAMLGLFLDASHYPYWATTNVAPPPPLSDSWAIRDRVGELRERYARSLAEVDARVGRVLDALDAAGRAGRTIVVVTGDHGEAFREHGVLFHGSRLDEEQLRVPFLVRIPGVAPRRLSRETFHFDVAPTVLARLGVAPPAGTPGIDMLSEAPRPVPAVVGSCGIYNVTGLAAYVPDGKLLFQFDGTEARAVGLLGAGDVARPFSPSAATDALLAQERGAWLALLSSRQGPAGSF